MKGRLSITFNDSDNQILIEGNSGGLKYLSDVCLCVIDKEGPTAHFHLMDKMDNLDDGSINTVIAYIKDIDNNE